MASQEDAVASYHFEIYADHRDIFLEDCEQRWGDEDLNLLFNDGAFARHLGAAPGRLCIMTACWRIIPLNIVVRDAPPGDDWAAWDHVAEASLEVRSGCLVISTPATVGSSDEPRIRLVPSAPFLKTGTVYVGKQQQGGASCPSCSLLAHPSMPPKKVRCGDWPGVCMPLLIGSCMPA